MFTKQREQRMPGEPRAATKEQQRQNLVEIRERKEGQIRALMWMARVVQNQLDREHRELETIKEDIEEML